MIALVSVYNDDPKVFERHLKFLYKLLGERKPWQNISHREMPTWEEHVRFVESKPYISWFVVCNGRELIGATYLSKDIEIGIFLLEEHQHKGYGTKMLDALYQHHKEIEVFKTNTSPLNSSSMAFFNNKGFQWWETTYNKERTSIIQHTFFKVNPYYVAETV